MPLKLNRYTSNFAGTERIASAIGNGDLADIGHPIVDGDVNIEMPLSEQTQKKPRAIGAFLFRCQ